MKRNALTIVIGALLILIFVLLLFTFQVRQTQVAVVTTFDRPTRLIETPGLKWKWPVPIQKVYKFDKRIHNFEGKFQETLTRDNLQILVSVYAGWTIRDPQLFFNSFPSGEATAANPKLEGLIQTAKTAVIGKRTFADFIATDKDQLKLNEIEKEILRVAQSEALKNYGIEINFLRIKRIGLPESVTQKVFDRMTAERQSIVSGLNAAGEAEAMKIRSAADRDRDEILARANAEAMAIRGEADAEAAKLFAVYKDHPELAIYLMDLEALKEISKERTTLILDQRTAPLNRLVEAPEPRKPGARPSEVPSVPPDSSQTFLGSPNSAPNSE